MYLVLGDWSDDGHGKTEKICLEFNKTVEEIQQAYKDSCKLTGINFHSADGLCVEYEDNSVSDKYMEILEQFDGLVEKRKNHAKFTARNQIGNFNSLTTKIRAQNLGITQAIWRTSRDERVRPCHHARRDKVFDLDKGLYSSCDQLWLLPGVDFQCRCDYELIIPEDDED